MSATPHAGARRSRGLRLPETCLFAATSVAQCEKKTFAFDLKDTTQLCRSTSVDNELLNLPVLVAPIRQIAPDDERDGLLV